MDINKKETHGNSMIRNEIINNTKTNAQQIKKEAKACKTVIRKKKEQTFAKLEFVLQKQKLAKLEFP